ncbi:MULTISPECIES: hypothetical protein [unclassified Kitasatospora]|uniref:hypothetical protein n=1 Tax=unclassified Kitasatospora TaxID=2633591 RepID=UPI0033CBBD8A
MTTTKKKTAAPCQAHAAGSWDNCAGLPLALRIVAVLLAAAPARVDLAFAVVPYLSFRRHAAELLATMTNTIADLRRAGDRHHEAGVLNCLGKARYDEHRYEEAVDAFTGAVALFRAVGDRQLAQLAARNLATAQDAVRR